MFFHRGLLLAAGLSAAIAPAQAQGVNDVRCALASNAASKISKDPNEKRLAEATLYFYLGRIDGRFESTQLAAAFAAQTKSLAGANLGPTMQACYKYAQQRMMFVQQAGEKAAPSRR